MTTLIVGASGATGRLLVKELVDYGESVKIIIRANSNFFEPGIKTHKDLSISQASILKLTDTEIALHIKGTTAVFRSLLSC